MNTSEQINELAAALAEAQRSLKNATLNKTNPHFRSKYADLAGIRDTVIPVLAARGIAVVQTMDVYGADDQTGVGLCTRLIHTSGQWIESMIPIPNLGDMQKMGSAITYARRYALSAIAVIAAEDDDDANSASAVEETRAPALVRTRPQPMLPGFEDWLADIEAAADSGKAAFEEAWAGSKVEFRNHLMATNKEYWRTLKARAAKALVGVGDAS